MTIHFTRRTMLGALPALGFAGAAVAQTPAHQAVIPAEGVAPIATLDAWLDLYGRPTAKVMLNGHGPFQFMVDTGSTVTVIAERHLATIGAPIVGKATVAGTTGMAETPLARVDMVEAGARKNAFCPTPALRTWTEFLARTLSSGSGWSSIFPARP